MGVMEFEEKRYRTETPMTWRQQVVKKLLVSGKVLDLGCGDGLLLKQLPSTVKAYGVDISPSAIKKCKKQGLTAQVIDFDGKKLSFKKKEFDTIVMLDVLEHLYFPQETLKEARRVGKKIIIAVPNFTSATARLQVLAGKVPKNNKPKKGHVQWITLPVLKEWLQKAGWKIKSVQGNYYLQSIPLIRNISAGIGKIFPNIFTTAFLVIAE